MVQIKGSGMAGRALLALALLLAVATQTATAACSNSSSLFSAQCSGKQTGAFCSFKCDCAGAGTQAPQVQAECSIDSDKPCFVWYEIAPINNTNYTYDVKIVTENGTIEDHQITSNATFGPDSPAFLTSPSVFTVDISYNSNASNDGVITNSGWLPCVADEAPEATPKIDAGIISLKWDLPVPQNAPTDRYVFEVLEMQEGEWHAVVSNISGKNSSFDLTHDLQCEVQLTVQTRLVLPDGSLGPACPRVYPPLQIAFAKNPSPPASLVVNPYRYRANSIRVHLEATPETGGCVVEGYEINVTELKTGNLVASTTSANVGDIDIIANKGKFNESGTDYLVSASTVTSFGKSAAVTQNFTINKFASPGCTGLAGNKYWSCGGSSSGSYCDLSCACWGGEQTTDQPQMSFQCDLTNVYGGSFLFYELQANGTNVDYDFEVSTSGGTTPIIGNTSGTALTPADQIAWPGVGIMKVSFQYPDNAAPTDGATIRGVWIPCSGDKLFNTSLVVQKPSVGGSSATIAWQVPFNPNGGPTDRIVYNLWMRNHSAANPQPQLVQGNLTGDTTSYNVQLARQCEPYEFGLRSAFMFENKTIGPDCDTVYQQNVSVYVRQGPSVSEFSVSTAEANVDEVPVVWSGADDGGCSDLKFTVTITETQTRSTVAEQETTSTNGVTIKPGNRLKKRTDYTVTMVASSSSGTAQYTTRFSFGQPGATTNGMGPGAVAGTVIGVLAGVALLALGVIWLRRRRAGFTRL